MQSENQYKEALERILECEHFEDAYEIASKALHKDNKLTVYSTNPNITWNDYQAIKAYKCMWWDDEKYVASVYNMKDGELINVIHPCLDNKDLDEIKDFYEIVHP